MLSLLNVCSEDLWTLVKLCNKCAKTQNYCSKVKYGMCRFFGYLQKVKRKTPKGQL